MNAATSKLPDIANQIAINFVADLDKLGKATARENLHRSIKELEFKSDAAYVAVAAYGKMQNVGMTAAASEFLAALALYAGDR